MQHLLRLLFFFYLLFCSSSLILRAQDLDLHGTISHQQADSYVAVPFEVPPGVQRLDVSFTYTGGKDHTTLDLGLLDPQRFRGWSGGNKHAFSIGTADATPSYLPGPLPPGPWKLLIGVALPWRRPQLELPGARSLCPGERNRYRQLFICPHRHRRALVSRRSAHAHCA